MAILLFENNGSRIVYCGIAKELYLEELSLDSLGAPQWKTVRVILEYFHEPGGGKRKNMLHDFMLNLFDEGEKLHKTKEKYQEQLSRRLET